MPLLPVAFYGLEVPCGDQIVPAVAEFPATFRITMAAIDPTQTKDNSKNSLATLKIIRELQEEDDDDDDEEQMRALLAESDSSGDDESDEEKNGGPSDPSKTKKARKAAALQQLMDSVAGDESDEEMKDAPNSAKVDNKGKSKATSDDKEGSDSSDSEDEDATLEEFVLCTLDSKKKYQQPLDITIGENELVYFKVTGDLGVHLTGNYVISDDNSHSHLDEEYDSDEDEDYDLSPDEDELDLDLDDEEGDGLDSLENPRITEIESSNDEAPKSSVIAEKKKGKNKRPADDINEEKSLDNMISESSKSGASAENKLSKKQLKKLKKNNGDAALVKSEESKKDDSDKSDKADKKVQFAKNLEQGPTGSTDKPKSEASGEQKKASLGVKTVDGVKIDDKKLGSGRACKKGDKVFMRYIGKLVNGSVFDSNKKGTPFSFKLGAGEVIRGWDIGVAGMAPGSERRLTIPPNKGYGSKAMPGIPANSTLIFDIKMLEVK